MVIAHDFDLTWTRQFSFWHLGIGELASLTTRSSVVAFPFTSVGFGSEPSYQIFGFQQFGAGTGDSELQRTQHFTQQKLETQDDKKTLGKNQTTSLYTWIPNQNPDCRHQDLKLWLNIRKLVSGVYQNAFISQRCCQLKLVLYFFSRKVYLWKKTKICQRQTPCLRVNCVRFAFEWCHGCCKLRSLRPFLLYCSGSRSGRFSVPCDVTNHPHDASPPSHRVGNCHAMRGRWEWKKKVIDTEEPYVLHFSVGWLPTVSCCHFLVCKDSLKTRFSELQTE